jgi:hypothetical protein
VERIKAISLEYLEEICKYWFSLQGPPHERVLNNGDFIEDLPTAKELLFKIKQWKQTQKATK